MSTTNYRNRKAKRYQISQFIYAFENDETALPSINSTPRVLAIATLVKPLVTPVRMILLSSKVKYLFLLVDIVVNSFVVKEKE